MATIPNSLKTLAQLRDVHAYNPDAAERKARFHSSGRAFLRQLAKDLKLAKGSFDIRSNQGGVAVSGEVTLHHERLYVQISDCSVGGPGLSVLYRRCDGRRDYTGGSNHFVGVEQLAEKAYEPFLVQCRTMIDFGTTLAPKVPLRAAA